MPFFAYVPADQTWDLDGKMGNESCVLAGGRHFTAKMYYIQYFECRQWQCVFVLF